MFAFPKRWNYLDFPKLGKCLYFPKGLYLSKLR